MNVKPSQQHTTLFWVCLNLCADVVVFEISRTRVLEENAQAMRTHIFSFFIIAQSMSKSSHSRCQDHHVSVPVGLHAPGFHIGADGGCAGRWLCPGSAGVVAVPTNAEGCAGGGDSDAAGGRRLARLRRATAAGRWTIRKRLGRHGIRHNQGHNRLGSNRSRLPHHNQGHNHLGNNHSLIVVCIRRTHTFQVHKLLQQRLRVRVSPITTRRLCLSLGDGDTPPRLGFA